MKISVLLSLAICLVACQQINGSPKMSNPDYCHLVQTVDYNLYEVLELGTSSDFQDMIVSSMPLLRRNAFESVELIGDDLIDGNINLFIQIKDDSIRKLQPTTPSVVLEVDGKKVQFFNVYNQLDHEIELAFADNDLALSTFEKLKFVNCK